MMKIVKTISSCETSERRKTYERNYVFGLVNNFHIENFIRDHI